MRTFVYLHCWIVVEFGDPRTKLQQPEKENMHYNTSMLL